ncbi:flagellar basal body P-ring formation chaperone FlgA [Crenobacter caeni]|uniref:Flagella basal body P-ring formation protein FlgA n=1 Tax=Crenobacter caeni TaxID=2705474 RepID=A0A6B2KRM0_9NEIS|nr:flagellar basal body P-ring formation chaperone FlgA [Crenobacter caeni]NDV12784.1 flagellar basal body P-ring formation protein FlgA [Crenobacter caeni]
MRICKNYQLAGLAFTLALCGLPAHAASPDAAEAVRAELVRLAQARGARDVQAEVTLTPPATPCAAGYRVTLPASFALTRFEVELHCGSDTRGHVARAKASAPQVVTRTPLAAGSPLNPDALTLARQALIRIDDALFRTEDAAGMSSRSPLKAGAALRARRLQASTLVKRGEDVEIVARQAGVEVRVAAQALAAGSRDEVIRVRNLASGQVIDARVSSKGEVEPVVR